MNGRYTLHQLIPSRPLFQVSLQGVGRALAVQVLAGSLQGSVLVSTMLCHAIAETGVRSEVGVEEDMPVLEVLHVRAGLEVFLQRVAALVGGWVEGGFVDGHC